MVRVSFTVKEEKGCRKSGHKGEVLCSQGFIYSEIRERLYKKWP